MSEHPIHYLRWAACAVLMTFGLIGCAGSNQSVGVNDEDGPVPTPEEARTALDEALRAFNEHCIVPAAQGPEVEFPITLMNPKDRRPSFKYRQLWAMKEAGLLDTTAVQTTRDIPVHQFSLTKKGRAAQSAIATGRGYRTKFCYARPEVTRLDSIKAVYTSGPNPLANVWFFYRYRTTGTWGKSPALRRVFSDLNASLPGPETEHEGEQLLIRVDTAWIDRRLTGYEKPPSEQ